MISKHSPLGTQEHELLQRIARTGKCSSALLSSTQRLRFEMLGLIEDRADGVWLTERGRALAAATVEQQPTQKATERTPPRDRRGRRLGLRRRSPF